MNRIARYTQQAVRRVEDHATSTGRFGAIPTAHVELCGRSYLLPTLTVSRSNNAIEKKSSRDASLLHTRSQTQRKTPIVLDLHQVSSDGSPHAKPIKLHELKAHIENLQVCGCVGENA